MADILLIQPPIQDFYLTAKRTLPYGLASIAASLRAHGYSVAIIDGLATEKSRSMPWPSELDFLTPYYGRADLSPFGLFHQFRHFGYSLEHIARQARASAAFLIGISSLFTAYSDLALDTAAAVKSACPQARIVLGGHHPSALPEAVMAHPAVDFVLRGEGEGAMPLLAHALRSGKGFEDVPGLVWRPPQGGLNVRPPVVVENLDRLPVPAYDLISWKHYQRAGQGSLSLTAGRGCPWRCTYCAVNAATYHGFRRRGVERVMAELEAAAACRSMGFIDFEDEHLCADKTWVRELMSAIYHRFGQQRPELRAMNGLYAPSLDEQTLTWLKKAGFSALNLALITTSAPQLRRFGRPDTTADLDRVLRLGAALGFSAVAYLIVAGPGQEPGQSVIDLLHLAQRRVLSGVSVFYPAPGSGDYAWCGQNGLLPSTFGLMRATALPLVHLTDRRQAITLLRLGRILNFMKSLMDRGEPMPLPGRPPRQVDGKTSRMDLGRRLLAAFLKDGAIYGVDHNGTLYDHRIDKALARQFLNGLKDIRLRGTQ